MPDYTAEAPEDITAGLNAQLANPPYPGFQDSLKLDAPLAVQAQARPGFFPFNKFNSVPSGITAARQAFGGSGDNDAFKRLMIVPNCQPFFQPAMPAVPSVPGTVIPLFDGQTLKNWRMAGRGTFHAIDGALQSVPSFDLGLFWCTIPMPQNFRLELEFFTRLFQTNSGVFIRFKNPESTGYYNPTLSAVFIPGMSAAPAGFQIQIEIPGRRMGPRNIGPEQFMPSITQATPLQILQYRRRPR